VSKKMYRKKKNKKKKKGLDKTTPKPHIKKKIKKN